MAMIVSKLLIHFFIHEDTRRRTKKEDWRLNLVASFFVKLRVSWWMKKLFVLLALILFVTPLFAQRQRPKLLQPQHSKYAGRILLIPYDGRPVSWKLPRMVAHITDYEIIYPPRELLGDATNALDADRVIEWAKKQDYEQLNGVIVSLDALAGWTGEAKPEQAKARLAFVNWVRQRKPDLPIYGFTQKARDEISSLVFDDLLIEPDGNEAAYLLVARFLHRTYQRPLKILPVASAEYPAPVLQALTRKIEAVGGQLVTSGKADLFLFLHMPNTDATKQANFAEALAKAIAAGYYVALADVSGNAEPLIAILREHKQLDLLQAYSATPEPEIAIGKALAQCSARLIAAKVLRTSLEIDQLRRAERAQVELMVTRYLEDWGYASKVRTLLETHVREQLKADPGQLGTATEAAETFLNHEIKLLAEELFRSQFRYNLHSVKLGDGTRVNFQVELLQRCKARLPWQHTAEIELDIGIHLPMLVGINPYPARR